MPPRLQPWRRPCPMGTQHGSCRRQTSHASLVRLAPPVRVSSGGSSRVSGPGRGRRSECQTCNAHPWCRRPLQRRSQARAAWIRLRSGALVRRLASCGGAPRCGARNPWHRFARCQVGTNAIHALSPRWGGRGAESKNWEDMDRCRGRASGAGRRVPRCLAGQFGPHTHSKRGAQPSSRRAPRRLMMLCPSIPSSHPRKPSLRRRLRGRCKQPLSLIKGPRGQTGAGKLDTGLFCAATAARGSFESQILRGRQLARLKLLCRWSARSGSW